MELMASQRADVFEALRAADFGSSEFEWRVDSQTTIQGFHAEPCSSLRHTSSGYYHTFVVAGGMHGMLFGIFSPGPRQLVFRSGSWASWETYIRQNFPQWLASLRRELTAPTPWEDLANRLRSIPSLGSSADDGNAPFTAEETGVLRLELDAMRAEIQASHRFSREQATTIEADFNYIKQALERLGRFDWRRAALGAFCSLAVKIGIPVVAKLILHLASRVFGANEPVEQLPPPSDTV